MGRIKLFLVLAAFAGFAREEVNPPWPAEESPRELFRFGNVTWAWGVHQVWRIESEGPWTRVRISPGGSAAPALPMLGVVIRQFRAESEERAWAWVGSDIMVSMNGGRTWRRKFSINEDDFLGQTIRCEEGCERAWLIISWVADPKQPHLESRGIAEYRSGKMVGRTELMRTPRIYGVGLHITGNAMFTWIDGELFRSTNRGKAWVTSKYGCEEALECEVRTIWTSQGQHYLLRKDGQLLRSLDSGASWVRLTGPLWPTRRGGLRGERFVADGDRWLLLGTDLRIHESRNQGRQWRALEMPGDLPIKDFGCALLRCLALGTRGELLWIP
jgi:photosystem II stability/assembly factor-like uncharacterized protein